MTESETDQQAALRPKTPPQATTRILAEVAMMIALATALNTVKIFTFPQGGSVTLGAMVPLLFLALRRGAKVGFVAGAVFGIIDVYFEPFIYNPIQFLLDYPIAFGALGLTGLFRDRAGGGTSQMTEAGGAIWSVAGVAVGIFGRFVCHFLSGIIFFASYAPPTESPALYSAVYNASYLVPEFAISAFVIFVLSSRGVLRVGL